MKLGIQGKRALLLAASQGLGYAVAHALASEGFDVVVSSSSLEHAQAAAGRIAAESSPKIFRTARGPQRKYSHFQRTIWLTRF